VRTKDSCWSVRTIYYPRELPGVSTAGPGIGQGVTKVFLGPSASRSLRIFRGSSSLWKNDLPPRRGYCWGSSSLPKVLKTKISFVSDVDALLLRRRSSRRRYRL
jgi:hypothetical protein